MLSIDDAPNFASNYPLGGRLIGPAWREAWRILADGQWHRASYLAAAMIDAAPEPIARRTCDNLLRGGRAHGSIQVRYSLERSGGRTIRVASYRRA